MRTINIITSLLAATLATAASAYEAHEWGTFTALVGSDGRTQNGMNHEDEPLPSFVYKFGETRRGNAQTEDPFPPRECPRFSKACFDPLTVQNNVISQKMETPVIYFYARAEETPLNVNVNVRFPEGVVTESFPGPILTSPQQGTNITLANGNTTYDVTVLNDKSSALQIPFVEPGNIYGHARNVASNIIRSGSEYERFIFYRGLGRFTPRIQISSYGGDLTLNFPQTSRLPATFLVNVHPFLGARGIRVDRSFGLETVRRTQIEELRNPTTNSTALDAAALRTELIEQLITAGLRRDEATAMLNTWENGYLRTPGLRLLYILPRNEVDDILPVTMSPAPEKFRRVFVARLEVMLDTDERELVRRIDRELDSFRLDSLGRIAEPMLRRAREVAQTETKLNARTRPLIDELIIRAAQGTVSPDGGLD